MTAINKEEFDYKNHYKKLISDLTVVLTESINQIPERDKDTPPDGKQGSENLPVTYPRNRRENKPLIID